MTRKTLKQATKQSRKVRGPALGKFGMKKRRPWARASTHNTNKRRHR